MASSKIQQPYNNIFFHNIAMQSIGTMLLAPYIHLSSLNVL